MQENLTDIHEENITGEFFVNDQCIICDMCFEIAPYVFRASSDREQSIVFKQPTTKSDLTMAEEALEACPVMAIERIDA